MRHLIDPTDLTVAETEQIVALAEDIIANRAKYSEACRGKKLATLFYEPSTRTRLSFTAAMLELGGEDAKIIFFQGSLEERMNGSCAGGTGAFIDQMATLLNITPDELKKVENGAYATDKYLKLVKTPIPSYK